jgi:multimeric flavodoxin WrbA
MNGQMKTFIDRTCPIYSMIRDKEIYYIVSAAGGQMPVERAVKSLQVYTNCLSGTKEKGVISVTRIWDAGLVKGTQSMDKAYSMGAEA